MNQLPTYDNMSAAYEYLLNGTTSIVNSGTGMGIAKGQYRQAFGPEALGVTQLIQNVDRLL